MSSTTAPGFSVDSTPLKWERLVKLLNVHILICKALVARKPWLAPYVYLDFYAGPGLYPGLPDGIGSPIRALKLLRTSGLAHRVYLFDPNHIAKLRDAVVNVLGEVPATFHELNCRDAVKYLNNQPDQLKIGMAFFDPNGQADWPAIQAFANQYRYMDLLINVNTALIKRLVKSSRHNSDRVMDYLKRLGRECIYLWEPSPSDKFQFCLAFCTNCKKFPEFRRHGFYELQHAYGQKIERRINWTADELDEMNNLTGLLPFSE